MSVDEEKRIFNKNGIDFSEVRPYGDEIDDGMVQLSFTLPVPPGPEAEEAAVELMEKMNFKECEVVHSRGIGEEFTFFVMYCQCIESVNYTDIEVARVPGTSLSYSEINQLIEEKLQRAIRVVGACTGSDAHTVGLDAIMNMKGYSGDYGLERYPQFETWNMGSQVPNEELIKKAVEVDADALLVSQVVTQRDVHLKNLTELMELLEAEEIRDEFITVVGGPRISHELAVELGFDAGFGAGTSPEEVASFLACRLCG